MLWVWWCARPAWAAVLPGVPRGVDAAEPASAPGVAGCGALEGELPVNTFGGSLSEGRMHGMGHIAEAVRQVTGRAEKRQLKDAEAVCAIDGSPMLRGSGIVVTKSP